MRQAFGQLEYPTSPEHTLNELAMETRLALVPDEWAELQLPAEELSGEIADEQIVDTEDSA
jgi:hypothetical protein